MPRQGSALPELTGAEAGLVTAGAAASLTLAAAACLAGADFARMDQLPDTSGMPNEIVIARSHRNGYDHALRAAGARLVEVGLAERTRDPQPWEIASAINDRTVAVAFSVGFSPLPLAEFVAVAKQYGVPVIVDASAALPPRGNLRKFIAEGADLVAFTRRQGNSRTAGVGHPVRSQRFDRLGRAANVGYGFRACAMESAHGIDRSGDCRSWRSESRAGSRDEGGQGRDRWPARGARAILCR